LKTRVHLIISGRVQGVFYRSTTSQEARLRGVTGWIRNLPDGRVEAVFEGEKEAIEDLIAFCWHGSRSSKVTDIRVDWQPYVGEFAAFEVCEG
jgi:acylphosphatase